ncbi:MAG: hypothetical protein H7Z37_19015 [Pyrinomonadaceae bacterium]|nr:hypothetical protein [Pyrinomonadaceae bacterium]
MKLTFLVFVLIAASIFNCNAPLRSQQTNFDVNSLSEKGRTAYQLLLTATEFQESAVGYAGSPSDGFLAFYEISKEKSADAAFKSLLEKSETAGQLYALIGLYKTDNAFFRQAVENYRGSKKTIQVFSGCTKIPFEVGEIVDSKGKAGGSLDILSGAYTTHFLERGEQIEDANNRNNQSQQTVNKKQKSRKRI